MHPAATTGGDTRWAERAQVPLQFFTAYSVVLVLFSKYTHRYINLLLMTCIVVAIAFFLFYIHPRSLDVGRVRISSAWQLLVIDAVFHWMPFLYVVAKFSPYYRTCAWGMETCVTVLVVLAYAVVAKPLVVYNADPRMIVAGGLVGCGMYAVIVS